MTVSKVIRMALMVEFTKLGIDPTHPLITEGFFTRPSLTTMSSATRSILDKWDMLSRWFSTDERERSKVEEMFSSHSRADSHLHIHYKPVGTKDTMKYEVVTDHSSVFIYYDLSDKALIYILQQSMLPVFPFPGGIYLYTKDAETVDSIVSEYVEKAIQKYGKDIEVEVH